MGLRAKTIAIVSCIFLAVVVSIDLIFSQYLIKQVQEFEVQLARKNLERVRQGVVAIQAAALERVVDWGHWDETERFVLGKNPDYIESNLTYSALEAFDTEHFLFIKGDGGIYHAGELSYANKKIVPLEKQKANEILRHKEVSSFMRRPNEKGLAGLILVSGAPVFVSVSTITDNYLSKKQSGFLIFTKTFSDNLQEQIRRQSQLPVKFKLDMLESSSRNQDGAAIKLMGAQTETGSMAVVGGLPGLDGRQILSVEFSQSRETFDRAIKARSSLLWMMAVLLLVANGVVLLFLDRVVLMPLSRLTKRMESISQTSDLSLLIDHKSNDEIGRLAKVFNGLLKTLDSSYERLFEAKSVAQQANVAKSRFIALVSHELRTPIQSVMGMLGVLKKNETSQNKLAFIEMANNAVGGLNDTVDEILDFAKLEAGQMPLEGRPFHLRELIRRSLRNADTRKADEARSVELWYDIAPDVPDLLVGDDRKLGQIFVNLLGNAFKFTREGEIELRVTMGRSLQEALPPIVFTVRDTGIGISSRQLPYVFTPFYRARTAASSAISGTGLGLAIVQQIVTQQGGEISVSSRPGEGTTFTVTLPFERGEPIREVRQSTSRTGRRLALIGGASRSVAFLSESLGNYGHSVYRVDRPEGEKWVEQLRGIDGVVFMVEASTDARLVKQVMPVVADLSVPAIVVVDPANILIKEELAPLGVRSFVPIPASADDIILAFDNPPIEQPVEVYERPDASGEADKCLNILLAEDTATNALVLRSLLEDIGHHVEVVTNGLELLNRLRPIASGNSPAPSIDLVITDIQMPLMDGDVAAKRIRLIEECSDQEKHLPIIAVTARALPDEVEHIRLSGIDEVLTKPVSEQDLVRAIHAHTGAFVRARKPARTIENALISLTSELVEDLEPLSPGESSRIPLIDIEEIFARSGKTLQNTRIVLESFMISFGDIRAALEQSIAIRDSKATFRALHSLKGLLLDSGASAAATLVEECETRWRGNGIGSSCRSELEQLVAALDPVLSLAQRLVQELPIQTEDFPQ